MSDTTTRRFYALLWIYGRATWSNSGARAATYAVFDSAADRDAWVAERSTDYTGNAGYREALPSTDAELRRLLRDPLWADLHHVSTVDPIWVERRAEHE